MSPSKVSFNLVLKVVQFTHGFHVSYGSIIAFLAAVSPHKSAPSIKEETDVQNTLTKYIYLHL